ncbi:MAG TPA: LppA family lipoprotein [Actinomycetaceae bacterium]|nr:LppA family lipoprotein [Actinomycetaceae bacterium]
MISTRSRRRAALGLAATAVAAVLLSACAPSPTTNTTDAEGNAITVDWVDYPASAGIPANDVLILPTAEEVEARANQLITEVQDTLETEYGITGWTTQNEAGWYPQEGNGYGGKSLLTTYNSASHEASVRIPVEQWDAVIDTVREIAERYEITDEASDTYFEEYPEWMRVRSFHRGAEFFDVVIEDDTLNPDHKGDESNDELVTGVSLFYGITTISETDRAEFMRRAAPFEGLKMPEATTSD